MTLIEIIGVVAVIAVLASVLAPGVLRVIARGKVSSTAQSLAGLLTVTSEFLALSNALPTRLGYDTGNAAARGGRFDADLLRAGLMDRLFKSPIGNQGVQGGVGCGAASVSTGSLLQRGHVRSAPGGADTLVPSEAALANVNFDLDRNGSGDFDATRMVVFAYLPGVSAGEAALLNQIVDCETNVPGVSDLAGRCINSSSSSSNTVTVYVYLGSQ